MEENKVEQNLQETGKETDDVSKVEKQEKKEDIESKFDELLTKRMDGVAKSILKSNGMEDDEIKTFIESYRAKKKEAEDSKINELELLKSENESLKKSIYQTKLNDELNKLANELNFDSKYTSQIIKLADMSGVRNKGEVNSEKLKEAVNKVLEECEVFKNTKKTESGFTKIGSEKKEETDNTYDKVRAAMGLK